MGVPVAPEPFRLAFDRTGGAGAGDESQVGSLLQARRVTHPAPQVAVRVEEGSRGDTGRWDSAPVAAVLSPSCPTRARDL